jgi:Fe-S-cluster-containing hydrogenase component 2
MKITRNIIQIDEQLCDGCASCVPSCAEGAIKIVDGKARVISENLCDGLGACLGECPTGALKIVERRAEKFDEEAVEVHLQTNKQEPSPCECPSAKIQQLTPQHQPATDGTPENIAFQKSELTNWPVQIRLVPPDAPFLKGADLLVVSDCTPLAYPDFHRTMLKGKVVLMGCPKFDNREQYKDKFSNIFKHANINSVTVVIMEVPCCHGMPQIVHDGMNESGKKIPLETIVISLQGEILKKTREAI